MPAAVRRIGVLTGGGDAPGLNAVIRAVVKAGANCNCEVIGLEDSFDGLHVTAEAHHRVIVVEVMGRYAGWIALYSGVAGGADVILIPEIPYDIEKVAQRIRGRDHMGARFSIVVAAEGAKPVGGSTTLLKKAA